MLNAQALVKTLDQVLGNGVEHVILVTTRGSLLASASQLPDFDGSQLQCTYVAMSANLWRAYATCDLATNRSTGMLEPESLEAIMIDLGDSKVCAVGVGGSGILLLAGQQVELGMLKLKATSLQRHLDPSLRSVMS
jgi:predicted regulator of Ras-like GTPase activity (Roadblock/LC7/MglB family)